MTTSSPSESGPPDPERGQRRGVHHRARRPRRLWPLLSVVAIVAGVAVVGNIGWFYLHSHTGGSALIHRQRAFDNKARGTSLTPKGSTSSAAACTAPPSSSSGPEGLLQAPTIGMQAPVVEGVGNAQLADAVGHVPASAWPGPTGTTVLSAHDVSWFSQIDHLSPGAQVRYVTPCHTYLYTVTGHQVVAAGSPVYNTSAPRLVMVTCYPLNALFLTPKRYVVDATLTRVVSGGRTATVPSATTGDLATSVPAAVAASVAPRVTTTAPLGTLTATGTPAAAWRQSVALINGGGSVLTEFFGALDIAGSANQSEWGQLAPSVPLADAAPLEGATITGYPGSVTPTLSVSGTTVTGAQVAATMVVSGSSSPGTYQVTMTSSMQQGQLVVTGWSMIQVSG